MLQIVKVSDINLSSTNTKSRCEGPAFDDLVASIKEKGVLVPILLRKKGKTFELIAGERRLTAAKEIGLKDIPSNIVEMDDVQAREAQIVENLQRADIHPLDEGESYRILIEESGYKVDDVAMKVGKSASYVRDRLVLTNLISPAKKAFRASEILPTHAAMIARLDDKQQKDALEYATDEWDKPSIEDMRKWIQDRILEDSMKNPPWKDDEALQTALGGCEECQGKGGDLFGKKAADACTNPKCYSNRLVAFIAIKRKENPALIALTGNYSNNGDVIGTSSYKEINSKKDACEHEEKGIVIEGHGMGRIVRICRAPECKKHWEDKTPGGHYKPTKEERERRKKEREQDAKQKLKEDEKIAKALSKVKWPLSEKHLDVLLDLTFGRLGFSYLQPVASRHGIKAITRINENDYKERDIESPLRKWIKEGGKNRKLQFVFEVIMESSGGADADELKKL